MTCTSQQKTKLFKFIRQHTLEVAAAKAGMAMNTARKYLRQKGKHPEIAERRGRHKNSVLDDIWEEISNLLSCSPGLESKTIMGWLVAREPNVYKWSQLRTLQRRVREWHLTEGPDKEIFFPQTKYPGKQSQSDYTNMNSLNITIDGKAFPHLLFHFILPYSRWETVSVCYSESFDSLTSGFEEAVWELGGLAKNHRTDNLTAATHKFGNSREFNEKWLEVMMHYGIKPSRNNPGKSNENGSIEKSNDLYKKTINQQLLMRGHRNFSTISEYNEFLSIVTDSRNAVRKKSLAEEMKYLLPLPEWRWDAPKLIVPKVSSFSTIQVFTGTYSVPGRLIGTDVKVYVYPKFIHVYCGNKKILSMPRLKNDVGECINYRHVIHMLLRKPGAFEDYMYRDALFPRLIFRRCFDVLTQRQPKKANKSYLEVLHLAAINNEGDVAAAIELLLEDKSLPTLKNIKELLDIPTTEIPIVEVLAPNLNQYDELISHTEVIANETFH